jgi:sodium/potassium-transporting ATPase subunit alpha
MLYLDWPTIGDASESALMKFYQAIEPLEKTREKFPICELPQKQ